MFVKQAMYLRRCLNIFSLGPYIIPADTALMLSVISVHMNPKYYPNPEKFNPENFSLDAVAKRPKMTFLPFGAGPRNCIGRDHVTLWQIDSFNKFLVHTIFFVAMNYAILEMKLTVIALIRTFSFHTTTRLEDLKIAVNFSMFSLDGYKLSIKLRNRHPSYTLSQEKQYSSI